MKPKSVFTLGWLLGFHFLCRAALPDPLVNVAGQKISAPAQWPARRAEMIRVLEDDAIGHPPPPPGNVSGRDLATATLLDGQAEGHFVHLRFGPEGKLGFDATLLLPAGTNAFTPPFPVIVQPVFIPLDAPGTPGTNSWTNAAPGYAGVLRRGYAVMCFHYQQCGLDKFNWRTSAFFPAYPENDWGDMAAWAWGMSRCVDYLESQSFADPRKFIAVGHSRLGKTALVAGALDERFTLVAPAGSGCGGTGAYRFNGKNRGGKEGLEDALKHFPQWFGPGLTQFSNHVDRLPFDQHWFIALIAPRRFIAADGLDDPAASVNALVQSYLAAKPVFELLGVPDRIGLNFRPGGHRLAPEDWRAILDFADQQLRGRKVDRTFDAHPPAVPAIAS